MRSRFPAIETPDRDYRDLRSSTLSRKRGRDRYHKYCKFRAVDAGQAHSPKYEAYDSLWYRPYNPSWPLTAGDSPQILARVPKRAFLEAARSVLGCNHGRRCVMKRDKETIRRVEFQRGSRYARRLALSYLKTGFALPEAGWSGDLDYRRDWDSFYEVEPCYCRESCRFRISWDNAINDEVRESYGCCCFLDEIGHDETEVVESNDAAEWPKAVEWPEEVDWPDLGFLASWDNCDVAADDVSEWSVVEGEDIPSL